MHIKKYNLNLNRFDGSLNNFVNCDGFFINYIGNNADGVGCYFNFMDYNGYLNYITTELNNQGVEYEIKTNNKYNSEFSINIKREGVALIINGITIELKQIELMDYNLFLNNYKIVMDVREIVNNLWVECIW